MMYFMSREPSKIRAHGPRLIPGRKPVAGSAARDLSLPIRSRNDGLCGTQGPTSLAARFYKTLYGQVLIATVLGVAFGFAFPSAGASLRPLGDAFIRLIRMIVAPVVFCTVVVGIAGVGDVKALGKTGVLTLVYFEVVSTIALLIGLLAVNITRPGAGMNVDATTLNPSAVADYVTAGKSLKATEFLVNIIPTSIVDALARSDILQVLLFSIVFGLALNAVGARGKPLFDFID